MTENLLKRPQARVDAVIDTDAYNEIDDQFAIAYALRSAGLLDLKALYAAPFSNAKASDPEKGMEKSHGEILNVLHLAGYAAMTDRVYKGARGYLHSETEPFSSAACLDLSARAMRYTPQNPLYVIAIGAITNVASALLLRPERLGGHAMH